VLADLDNVRRRAAREQAAAAQQGRRAALLPLLPVLDALDRALETGSSDPSFVEGVASTQRLFLSALREAGAEPVPAGAGQPFDPRVHEAIAAEVRPGSPPGTVLREVRRGFTLGDDVLRPAHVVVAAGADRAER
jgi:molecular chaperone GrpE